MVLAAEPVGQVISFDLKFSAERDGKTVALKRHANIFVGDTLVTGNTSFAEIRMIDGAVFTLQPATRFQVNAYDYDPKHKDAPVKSDFKLLEGGFKTLTGLIVSHDPKSYTVTTSIAEMGVRGTYWGTVSCPQSGEYLGMKCKPNSVVMSVWKDPRFKKQPDHCGAFIKNKNYTLEVGPCSACSNAYLGDDTNQIQCTTKQSPLLLNLGHPTVENPTPKKPKRSHYHNPAYSEPSGPYYPSGSYERAPSTGTYTEPSDSGSSSGSTNFIPQILIHLPGTTQPSHSTTTRKPRSSCGPTTTTPQQQPQTQPQYYKMQPYSQ
jgi:hypothetical protein